MKVISVMIDKNILDEINENIVESKRSKLIDKFIIEQYQLPDDKEELLKINDFQKTDNMVIQPFSISDDSVYKLNQLIFEYKNKSQSDKEPNISMIFRDILYKFNDYVRLNPIEPKELHFVHLSISPELKEEMDYYIPKMDRSTIINEFIVEHYQTKESINKLKEVPSKKKKIGIYLTDESLEKLDSIVGSYKNNVRRTHIIRDVLSKLVKHLEINDIKGKKLKKKVKRTLEDLYKHNPEEANRILEEYAKKNNRLL